jgi:hypothetical protein
LNVTKATWTPLKVILPKQAAPWYQFVGGSGGGLIFLHGKINIAFRYTGSGKNLALTALFRWMMPNFREVKWVVRH